MHTLSRRTFVKTLSASAALSSMPWTTARSIVRAADAPVTGTVRLFSCGHSFHMFVYRLLEEMAKDAGFTGYQAVGKSAIGGSKVIQHWDVPDDKNDAKRLLKAGGIDVLTLAPIWVPDPGINNFVELGLKHNPNLRITLQEFWLPNDEYHPVYPLETRKGCDHDATSLVELRKAQSEYDRDLSEVVTGSNKEAKKQAVLLVPVGQASIALRENILAGKVPGYKTQGDLFRDPWGHPQAALQVLNAYCHFAVIFRRNPTGLPVVDVLDKLDDLSADDKKKLNQMLQEIAWNAVTSHPLSGVHA